jgi:ribosomal protein S27E
MTITEKVAYIQGLYDGLDLDSKKSGEARILSEMLDVLKEVGQQLDSMDAAMDQFDEELDALGDTVADLEDAVFDDEDEEDAEFEDYDDLDEDFFEIPCPTCGEDLVVDDEALAAGVVDCPACGGKFALSFEDEESGGSDDE